MRNRKKRSRHSFMMRRRNDLLQRQTHCERLFGRKIKKDGIYKFMRQKGFFIGKSFRIVDFYFPHRHVAVEIDGGYHSATKSYDEYKDTLLNAERNIGVLRIKNEELEKFDFEIMYKLLSITNRRERFRTMDQYYSSEDTIGRFIVNIPSPIKKPEKEVKITRLPPGPEPKSYCMKKYAYVKSEKKFKKKTIIRKNHEIIQTPYPAPSYVNLRPAQH